MVVPGLRKLVMPFAMLASTSQSSPMCMWLSQMPGTSVLPLPSMTRAPPASDGAGRADRRDLAVAQENRLVLNECALVRIEQADVVEQHRRLGLGRQETRARPP